jgi:regulator of sigma D
MNKDITAARRQAIEAIISRWKEQRETLHHDLDESLYSDHALQIDIQDFPIEHFCESLMDYISAGHFEVYETLLHESTAELEANRELLEQIYHSIETTTDLALSFNDKYRNEEVHSSEDASLPRDLQSLDDALTLRFALEDQLLEITGD